ncbi:uncharacterized protein LOC133819807 isoform X2 [Humulus lupulus]|uniref:uncharacterized protein LOC133819807 isoform X2 n=1 Tax=Humulus lupulus TaxID=3486 RepID=UPI002B40E7DF|nr:uncharacterized protein LOC133819807 isoform X2 [Humulus lupulus]
MELPADQEIITTTMEVSAMVAKDKEDKSAAADDDKINDKLFEDVMKNNWKDVIETYNKSSQAQMAKLTKSGDTALHIAVSNEKTEIALKLVEAIKESAVLMKLANGKGNSPLHLAAMLGNLEVCKSLTSKNKCPLLTVRNKSGETPIFLAVLHGKRSVFFYYLNSKINEEFLRRKNGDNILHVAISGEYFDMAMAIIENYKTLINFVNEDGLSPLHVLANKPNAFKSSTCLGLFDRIIYYCLVVMEYDDGNMSKEKVKIDKRAKHHSEENNNGDQSYPENYRTCMDFVNIMRRIFNAVTATGKGKEENDRKAGENSSNSQKSPQAQGDEKERRQRSIHKHFFPPNYDTILLLFKLAMKLLLIVLGLGIWRINEVQRKKELHVRAKLVMEKLVENSIAYKHYGNTGSNPGQDNTALDLNTVMGQDSTEDNKNVPRRKKGRGGKNKKKKDLTALLTAAKTGATEMVEKILDKFPVAIQDVDSEQKNILLLAIESRQPQVYKLLLKRPSIHKESVFRHIDHLGNSALHLAATQCGQYRPWLIPGSALQMQWEIKWFEFVKNSMPPNFFPHYNKKNQTPNEVFVTTHKDLIKDGSEWLTKTSESCSVVAALVATVAFATSATVPGGINEEKGVPNLESQPAFNAFALTSLAALCFSVTALVFFLSILTSRYQEKDFALDLPRKLLLGLTSLFASIASMLVSFCAGHIFVLNKQLRYVAYPLYAALCFPITFFAFAQLSLYFDLMLAIFKRVPQRSYEVLPH